MPTFTYALYEGTIIYREGASGPWRYVETDDLVNPQPTDLP